MIDDPSHVRAQAPLAGVVMCCTSISAEDRSRLADVAIEMGAIHKLDLTSDVTHLIVGNVETAKYKYVARERPDVKALLPQWIDAVRESWMEGEDTDVAKLEEAHKVPIFYGLKICVTGFDDPTERQMLAETVERHGAQYHGDLTREVTHLIVAKPEGKKYQHARTWHLHCVAIEWFKDSIRRGMALEEALYDPLKPVEERGKGAFVTVVAAPARPVKRAGEDALDLQKRKLRRTASVKFGSQNETIWADITAVSSDSRRRSEGQWEDLRSNNQETDSRPRNPEPSATGLGTSMLGPPRKKPAAELVAPPTTASEPSLPQGIFQGRLICLHGFDDVKTKILRDHLEPNGALLLQSAIDFERHSLDDLEQGFLVVPNDRPVEQLPPIPEQAKRLLRVTNWWVEKCLFRKELVDPLGDVTCRPFPSVQSKEFSNLVITSTGFSNVDLLHLSKVVKLLGATYEEYLKPETSFLICNPAKGNAAKLKYAHERAIPVVSYDWLLDSLEAGMKKDVFDYMLQPLKDVQPSDAASTKRLSEEERAKVMSRSRDSAAAAKERQQRHPQTTSKPAKPLPKGQRSPAATDKAASSPTQNQSQSQSQASPILALPSDPTFFIPLQEISSNSPRRRPSDSSTKSSLNEKDENPNQEDLPPAPSTKAMEPPPSTNTIAALLQKSKSRDPSVALSSDKPSTTIANGPAAPRRRRGLLGRAASGASNGSRGESPAVNGEVEAEGDKEVPETMLYEEALPSQSLSYDDPDAQRARELMMKAIGGKVQGEEGRVQRVGTVTDSGPGVAEGGRRRGGRRG